ncbi:glycosyltransferase 61 family protein [Rhizobium terrae]|uniref:glycosyltransferase 61 family protein n=1 Tax=Rhizobium terrae TaxID=2171756 RepID=UPI001D01763A|nr:glycosyltransferase family 61 protein [Rhizobium terrae]
MFSFLPIVHSLRKAARVPFPDIEAAAADRWTIAPATKRFIRPAKFLPHHLDRIKAAQFGTVSEVLKGFRGNYETTQEATIGYRLADVDLIDGVLYHRTSSRSLKPRRRRLPIYTRPKISANGAIFESWVGNRWFGNWLADDCLTYSLADEYGTPVTTRPITQGHEPQYARKLDLKPVHVRDVHFDEVILFRDKGQNEGKKRRADQARGRLLASASPFPHHPGVFILRGERGDQRVLVNEADIALQFVSKYGFCVLDPSGSSVDDIIHACAGARVVVGVEGSHLVHGLTVMPASSTLFVIQPADRVVAALKVLTDREGQGYAFVVGEGANSGFRVEWSDIERTMDMVAA